MPNQSKNLSLFPDSVALTENDPFYFESWSRKAGYALVAGVDEAGRGPLAGPVVAGAVIIGEGTELPGVHDSKKMTEKAREMAFQSIADEALDTGLGIVSHHHIDEFNILNASLEAMKRAVLALDPQPDFLLVDGIHSVPLPLPQKCLKKGDRICRSISAASVMAKVYRDRIMRSYHRQYPVYGFWENKGYGTKGHLKALRIHGPSPIHRMSFRGVA